MTDTYEVNKEKIPHLDEFENTKNKFLKDIHKKASVWILSDKQVWAANKAWENYETYGDKTPWEVNVERAPELNQMQGLEYNEFLFDIVDKAKRYVLSDKQLAAFQRAYKGHATRITPSDPEAFYMAGRAVSKAMQSSWIPDKLRIFKETGEIDKRTHDTIVEKADKYKKSIFGHLFDTKKYSRQEIQSYIRSINL